MCVKFSKCMDIFDDIIFDSSNNIMQIVRHIGSIGLLLFTLIAILMDLYTSVCWFQVPRLYV